MGRGAHSTLHGVVFAIFATEHRQAGVGSVAAPQKRFRRMGKDGHSARAGPRGARLALLQFRMSRPAPLPCGEFDLGQPRRRRRSRTAGKRAVSGTLPRPRLTGAASRQRARASQHERKTPAIPQFHDPSSALSRKRLHVRFRAAESSAKPVKVRLTISALDPLAISARTLRGDAEEREETDHVVIVVTKVPDATAGSARTRSSAIGIRMPPRAPAIRLQDRSPARSRSRGRILNQATGRRR